MFNAWLSFKLNFCSNSNTEGDSHAGGIGVTELMHLKLSLQVSKIHQGIAISNLG